MNVKRQLTKINGRVGTTIHGQPKTRIGASEVPAFRYRIRAMPATTINRYFGTTRRR